MSAAARTWKLWREAPFPLAAGGLVEFSANASATIPVNQSNEVRNELAGGLCIDRQRDCSLHSGTLMRTDTIAACKRFRRTAALLLLVALAPAMLLALFHDERHGWRNELFQMEDTWRDALLHGNIPTLSSLLADDYMAITANGMLQSKEQTVAQLRGGVMRFRSLVISDRKVRFYGSTAVVTSRAQVVGTTAEGDVSGNYRYTHVWAREGKGPWRIVSFEASRIRQPHGHK